jgi:hypothetical protein
MFPEHMCVKAFGELMFARTLSKHLESHSLGSLSSKQAQFLLWGGLRIEHNGQLLKSQNFLDWIYENVSADEESEKSRKLLEFLLQQVPSDAIIDERSKADALTKVLSCLQALWVVT